MLGEKVVVLGENGGDEQATTSKASNQQPGLIWLVGVFLGRVDLHVQCRKKNQTQTLPLIQDELDSWFGGGNRVRIQNLGEINCPWDSTGEIHIRQMPSSMAGHGSNRGAKDKNQQDPNATEKFQSLQEAYEARCVMENMRFKLANKKMEKHVRRIVW